MIDKQTKLEMSRHPTVYTWKKALILISVFVALFIIGSFYDFNISQTLYADDKITHRKIGSFLTDNLLYIAWAAWGTIFIACAKSSFVYKKDKLWLTIIINIITWAYIAYDFGRSLSKYTTWERLLGRSGSIVYNTIYSALLMLASLYFGLFCFNKLDQKLVFKVTFWFVIVCVIISNAREFLSILASRPRPRVIFDSEDPLKAYVPWWKFHPFHCYDKSIKNAVFYMSFPSGHSAETFFLIGFAGVLYRVKLIKKWKTANIVFGVSILIACLAPLGRVFGGWHYTSDVSMGSLFSIVTFFGMTYFLKSRIQKRHKVV